MAFQRSYSKVWWGSDNQLPFNATNHNLGSSLTSGGFYYSLYSPSAQSVQQSLKDAGGDELHHMNFSQSHAGQHQKHQQQSSTSSLYNQYSHSNGSNEYHSLDYNNHKGFIGNLSRIQEVDDENNISKLSWEKHDSPGSLRSQDSGFSDNDESHSTRSVRSGRSLLTTATGSPSSKSDISAQSAASSPSSLSQQTIETPPTVIRRVGKSQFYSPAAHISRRISFTGTPSKANIEKEDEDLETTRFMAELDGLKLMAKSLENLDESTNSKESSKKIRRRKRVSRKATTPLSPTRKRYSRNTSAESNETTTYDSNNDEDYEDYDTEEVRSEDQAELHQSVGHTAIPEYNNETVYLGEAPPPYNNETVVFGGPEVSFLNQTLVNESNSFTPMKNSQRFSASTSTPKNNHSVKQSKPRYSSVQWNWMDGEEEYENPLLNGHSPSLQHWLYDLKSSYDQEVMSTLQTKSISHEAYKNLTITTHTVSKLIRQLQQKALYMQSDFERVEKILIGESNSANLHDALSSAEQLIRNVEEFIKVLDRRAVFFSETRLCRKRYDEQLEQLRLLTKDIIYSLAHQQYINLFSLLDDIQVLKRNLLITVRSVFEKMVRIIVQSIEQSPCDLMLRANLNMISTLTNIDYDGFASLSAALVQTEAIRALLIVCIDHKLSSVRAAALRALSTVCSTQAAIKQFGAYEGIEIIRDILQVQPRSNQEHKKRTDTERRESVSVLTQITAAWHGANHKVDGLKDCIETIVEGLSDLVQRTECCQTVLLCAAALNNLSRIEATSHYSIMSNETISKLIEAMEARQNDDCIIFHYEQIIAMLNNMSANKKCHSHLANGAIISFITSLYQDQFHKTFISRSENEAKRHLIKYILHILTRLVHDSSLGLELIDKTHIPEFFKLAIQNGNISSNFPVPGDLTHLCNHSLGATSLQNSHYLSMKEESLRDTQQPQVTRSNENNITIVSVDPSARSPMDPLVVNNFGGMFPSGLKMELKRNESYV